MTKADFLPRVRTFAGLMRDMLWLVAVVTPMMTAMLFGLYSWNRDRITSLVRSELGIDDLAANMATKADVEKISRQMERIGDSVRQVRSRPTMTLPMSSTAT